ncbi:arsenate reductase/protein-tyrosine-phosphatase family protein [Humibacillus xanthopallidus]|uniref:Protein-tyrosine phosphatase n=1 Tax=Humibacillus xanthopallidus TaxID=412689 RepID=A0A543I0A1_9MICO|nr:low molecular weight phosphatase family protein [Humibacillus xanthopallidus]TQM64009.1 protein-tyrosine phosphatase [Humibacillus xanthopallidus]
MTEAPLGGAQGSGDGNPPAVGHIMVVCTGNICRSPYVERRLAQLLADTDVVVSSAGTRAVIGAPIEPGSAELLAAAGGSTDDFASRQITPALLAEADLVIAATQMHRAESVRVNPRVLRRTFTLGELADLLRDADLVTEAAQTDPQLPWARRLAEIALHRRGLFRARPPEESDIPDPYQRGRDAYAIMANEIEKALLVVGPALRPPIL